MNRKNKLRGQYFKKHNIDEKYNTIENEIHHIIEWNEAEKGLVSKQEVDSIGNLLLISKNKHTIITAKTNQFRESNIRQDRKEPPRKYYKIKYTELSNMLTLININNDTETIDLKIGKDVFLCKNMIPNILEVNEQLLKKYFKSE